MDMNGILSAWFSVLTGLIATGLFALLFGYWQDVMALAYAVALWDVIGAAAFLLRALLALWMGSEVGGIVNK